MKRTQKTAEITRRKTAKLTAKYSNSGCSTRTLLPPEKCVFTDFLSECLSK